MLATLVLVLVQSSSSMSSVSGRVVDPSGGALTGATVSVVCGNHRATAATDSSGRYHVGQLPASRCRISASLDGFASVESRRFDRGRRPTRSPSRGSAVRAADRRDATRGGGRGPRASPGRVRRRSQALETRPFTVVTQALKEEAGVIAQQTSASQGSPMLRGFTGQRNLYLIDGVRYNTAAWRDGPSQYMAWLPAADVDHIEVVRGPASAQYGSDALGGTIGMFAADRSLVGVRPVRGTLGVTLGAANQMRTTRCGGELHAQRRVAAGSASIGAVDDLRPGERSIRIRR